MIRRPLGRRQSQFVREKREERKTVRWKKAWKESPRTVPCPALYQNNTHRHHHYYKIDINMRCRCEEQTDDKNSRRNRAVRPRACSFNRTFTTAVSGEMKMRSAETQRWTVEIETLVYGGRWGTVCLDLSSLIANLRLVVDRHSNVNNDWKNVAYRKSPNAMPIRRSRS